MAGREAVRPIDILTELVLLYRFEGSRKRKLNASAARSRRTLKTAQGRHSERRKNRGRFQSEAMEAELTKHQVIISSQ